MSAPLRLLVIDDDEISREQVRRCVRTTETEIEITEATSITEGKALLRSGGIDCALLDYHLGDGTGLEMLGQLMDEQPDLGVPLILVTGEGNEDIAVQALKLGVMDYLNKDQLDTKSLEKVIRSALKQHELAVAEDAHRQQLEYLSMHDELTGLANRRLFLDRLDQRVLQAQRSDELFAVLNLDLDGFKIINDSFGHAAGDEVLRVIGNRLNNIARRSDTFARLGGDEFAVLLCNTTDVAGVITVVGKIAAAISESIEYEGRVFNVDSSIGIALYPEHGQTVKALMSHADDAMYSAKRSASRHALFSDDGEDFNEKARITIDLPALLHEDQLVLHYQPKFELNSGQIVGVEALARWHHDKLGNIPPGKFVPILERTKLVYEFTDLVIYKAIRQAALWRDSGNALQVSVNVSTRVLTDPDLPKRTFAYLKEFDLSPEHLTMEITESADLESFASSTVILGQLAEQGVGISLDDFGTGYTSIRYLREFPISEIKIDRMFVSELMTFDRDISIVSGILKLAAELDATTVAEGIETPDVLAALVDIGCEYGQGFFLAKPQPAEEIAEYF